MESMAYSCHRYDKNHAKMTNKMSLQINNLQQQRTANLLFIRSCDKSWLPVTKIAVLEYRTTITKLLVI
jgi:hypothetical protein